MCTKNFLLNISFLWHIGAAFPRFYTSTRQISYGYMTIIYVIVQLFLLSRDKHVALADDKEILIDNLSQILNWYEIFSTITYSNLTLSYENIAIKLQSSMHDEMNQRECSHHAKCIKLDFSHDALFQIVGFSLVCYLLLCYQWYLQFASTI